MLYQIKNGTVSVGAKTILSHVNFEIKGNEKIAVVGKNGVGKTTLLKLIAGELSLDQDDKRQEPGIWKSRVLTVGMLRQSAEQDFDKTVEELLLESCPTDDLYSKERYLYEMEYDRLFTGFGFQKEEKHKKFEEFSGGEQTKIALIRLFLMKPDILLLDEPTNHLDIQTTEWLEEYIREYEHAIVFVSHDRFFLDQVTDVVYELEDRSLRRYPGNYTQYREQKQKDIAAAKKAYERQQKELDRLNGLIERFKHKPKKAAFARSRKKIIERMELLPDPAEDDVHIFTGDIEPLHPGSKWVYEAEHLKIGYDKVLLELSLRVRRGQKIGIIGDNGAGKSTFLKTMAGLIAPIGGKGALGNNILMGYFDQQTATIQSEKTVYEHFHDLFPGLNEKDARHVLASYLFRGKEAQTKVSNLSGGEKSRLMLAELLYSRPNLLLLDEPTNHMDIRAKETLESAFRAYKGTMLFVSHDRYFIKQVADAILVFQGQKVMYYPFGYEHYLKRSRQNGSENLAALVQAEDQALIAGMRAVPEKERHRLREIGTDEAYLDWRFGLARKPMDEAEKKFAYLWGKWEQLSREKEELELRLWTETRLVLTEQSGFRSEETVALQERAEKIKEGPARMEQSLREAWDEWTEACLAWWDVYLEEFEEDNM